MRSAIAYHLLSILAHLWHWICSKMTLIRPQSLKHCNNTSSIIRNVRHRHSLMAHSPLGRWNYTRLIFWNLFIVLSILNLENVNKKPWAMPVKKATAINSNATCAMSTANHWMSRRFLPSSIQTTELTNFIENNWCTITSLFFCLSDKIVLHIALGWGSQLGAPISPRAKGEDELVRK